MSDDFKRKNVVLSTFDLVQTVNDLLEKNLQDAVNLLKEKCQEVDIATSATALHLLISLVEKGVLSLPQCLSILVSLVSTHKSPQLIVSAIGDMLLKDCAFLNWKSPYDITDRPHPLLTILRHNWKSWDFILEFIRIALLGYEAETEFFPNRLELVQPIAKAVFLDKAAPYLAKYQLLILYLDLNLVEHIVQFLSWQQIDYNWCCLIRETLIRSFDIAKRNCLVEAITPAAATTIQYLINHGHDPRHFFHLIPKCLKITKVAADPVLLILADILFDCPATYVLPIAHLCSSIVSSYPCNGLIASKVPAALLSWAFQPSSVTYGLQAIFKAASLSSNSHSTSSQSEALLNNPLFNQFSKSCSSVRYAFELSIKLHNLRNTEELTKWLNELNSSKYGPSLEPLFTILCAIAIQVKSSEASKVTFRLLQTVLNSHTSFNIICLLLYKLSQEEEPEMQLYYLKLIPQMAIDKENMPLILGTIESLKNGTLRIFIPMRLSMLLELWKIEPRTFPYLQRLLQDSVPSGEEGWEVQVTRSTILKEICTINPNQHGKDLVGLLSGILNSCSDEMGAVPSSIAIDAITELCRAHVVDIKGTWTALEPKMGKNRQPLVVASICRLLGEVPNLQGNCAAAITRLWSYITSGISVEASLTALGNFAVDDFTLKLIPEIYRKGLKLPAEAVKTAVDAAQRPEDVLTYVPGECWVLILERIPKKYQSHAEEMVSAILKKEVAAFPRGIYHLPAGQSEPTSYSYLPINSVLRGMTEHLQRRISSDGLSDIPTLLRILSRDYNRPLPHLNWSFLESSLMAPELCYPTLSLLVHQGPISASARKLLENYISTLSWEVKKDILFSMSVLPGLCRSVPPKIIHAYLSQSLQSALKNEDDLQDLSLILNGFSATIALGIVPEANKLAVMKIVEDILASNLSSEHPAMEMIADCVATFPEKVLNRITSPLLWWEVTSHQIRQAAIIKSAVATKQNLTSPLVCLNEIIDATCSYKEDHAFVIQRVLLVMKQVRSQSSCCRWLHHLMGRILNAATNENDFKSCLFLLDLFMASVIMLTGLDYLNSDWSNLSAVRQHRFRYFAFALPILFTIKDPDWSTILPPVVEGMHRLMLYKELPAEYHEALYDASLSLRCDSYCSAPSRWPRLFAITREKVH